MASHSGRNVVEVSTETITAIENVSKTAKLYPNKSRRLAERLKVFREHLSNASEKALTVLLDKHVFPPFIFLLKEVLTFLQRFTETQYLLKSYSSNIDPERFFDLTTKLVEFYDVFGIGGKSDTKAIVLEDAQDKKEDDSHHLKVLEGLKADNAKAVLGGLETQEARVVEALTSSAVIDAREIDQLRAKIKAIDTDFDNYGGSIEEDSNSVDMTTLECDRTHVQKIGEGKFGIVFKGQLFGAEVAVKYLRDAVIPADRQLIIRKEIAKLHLLKHDNIVKYYGAQTKSTPFFFVFEKIFCSLYSALYARDENEKLDLFKTNYRRKLEILIDCGRAIEYLHSVNVLYRNIKSTNILITSNGVAKICDFSFAMSKQDLSSLLGVASVRASITGTGTNLSAQKVFPAYLAPEIILSSNKDPVEYNVYTDVYAFGILINEVLTHTPPFPGLTFRNIMNKLQKSDNNRPMLFAHNYRAENQGNALILELRSLVERSWATNPLERPSFTHIVLILERIVLYADALASFTTVTEVSKSSVPSLDETNIGQSSFNARKSFYQRSGGNDNAESMYDMSNDANDLSFSRDAGDTSPVKTNKIATIIESYEKGFIATASVERERPHDRSFERSMDYGDANSQPSVFVKLYDKFEKSMDRPNDAVDKSRSFDRSRSDNRVSISKSVSMDRRTLHGVFEPTLEVEGSASNDRSDISSVNPAAEPNHSETPIEVKSIGIAIEHAVSIDSKATDESMNISKSNDSGVPADGAVGAKVAFSTTNYMEVNHTRTLDSYDSNAPRNIHIEKSHQSLDSFTQIEKSEEPVEYLGTQSVESISVESDPEYTHSKYIAQLFYDAGSCGKKDSQTKLEELAAQNDLLALGFLMGMLCYGSGMPKDVKKANDIAQRIYPLILQRADDESDSSRKFYQYIAGLCYEQGVGLEKNDFLAVKYYQMSADQGYAAALSNLGYCYKHGQGVKEDRYEAVRLYGLGADQNHATSLNNLGYCYQHGYGVQKDLQEAVRLYKRSADQGHSTAQNNLGYCYQYGQGCEKNLAEAVRLYEQSASQGCSFGQNSLGHCYKRGHGVPKDYAKAVYYYRLSAEQGHATAQNNLGYCYQYGQGVEVNYGEAVRWYKLSVEQGQASAENNLGFCYQCGIGVKKDLAEAVRLYKSSAEKGYAVAMYNLGLCYLNGMGVPNDPEKAVQLIRSSAEQGHTAGQVKLAMCYEEGVGVVKDTREAIRWYVMAARRGDETAMKALKRIHG